jgi:hypothetical protein
VLDEAAWQDVPSFDLVPVINTDEKKHNQPTRVICRWDRENLYVAFVCEDSDIWATMKQRDEHLWEEEVVEVFVDPDEDGKDYKEFEVNPLNNVVDLNIPQPAHGNLEAAIAWDCRGWKTAVRVEGTVGSRQDKDARWVCEMAIPLRDLAPPDAQPLVRTTWRVNFYRIDRPNKQDPKQDIEFSAWSAVQKGYHEPQRFGFLTFAADPYHDDFSLHPDGQLPGPPWSVVAGQWLVSGGRLVGTNGGTDGWIPVGLRGGLPDWTNYRLRITFQMLSKGSDWRDGPWFGVRCRGSDGYFVHFTDRAVQVHKSYRGRTTNDDLMVASWPFRLETGGHEVIIEVTGEQEAVITVAVDGNQVGQATDKDVLGVGPVPAGGIVLSPRRFSKAQGDTVVAFDDVIVETVK